MADMYRFSSQFGSVASNGSSVFLETAHKNALTMAEKLGEKSLDELRAIRNASCLCERCGNKFTLTMFAPVQLPCSHLYCVSCAYTLKPYAHHHPKCGECGSKGLGLVVYHLATLSFAVSKAIAKKKTVSLLFVVSCCSLSNGFWSFLCRMRDWTLRTPTQSRLSLPRESVRPLRRR
jgi:hypothetical protein